MAERDPWLHDSMVEQQKGKQLCAEGRDHIAKRRKGNFGIGSLITIHFCGNYPGFSKNYNNFFCG
jgi:hypothetical protein